MNVRDLHEKLRTGFACIDGLPRNYMEIPIPLQDQQIFLARFIYQSIGVTMRGEPDEVEPILCAWFWQRMVAAFDKAALEDRNILLMWRRWPTIESYIDSEGREATKLRARLVIPADNLKRVFGEATVDDGQLLYQL